MTSLEVDPTDAKLRFFINGRGQPYLAGEKNLNMKEFDNAVGLFGWTGYIFRRMFVNNCIDPTKLTLDNSERFAANHSATTAETHYVTQLTNRVQAHTLVGQYRECFRGTGTSNTQLTNTFRMSESQSRRMARGEQSMARDRIEHHVALARRQEDHGSGIRPGRLIDRRVKHALINLFIDESRGKIARVSGKASLNEIFMIRVNQSINTITPILMRAIDTVPVENENRKILEDHIVKCCEFPSFIQPTTRKMEVKWVYLMMQMLDNLSSMAQINDIELLRSMSEHAKETNYFYLLGNENIQKQCHQWNVKNNTHTETPQFLQMTTPEVVAPSVIVQSPPVVEQTVPTVRRLSPVGSVSSRASSRRIDFNDDMKRQVLKIFLECAPDPTVDSKPKYMSQIDTFTDRIIHTPSDVFIYLFISLSS